MNDTKVENNLKQKICIKLRNWIWRLEKKKWEKKLTHMHNVFPLGHITISRTVDMEWLRLYNDLKTQKLTMFLTGIIAICTAINVILSLDIAGII